MLGSKQEGAPFKLVLFGRGFSLESIGSVLRKIAPYVALSLCCGASFCVCQQVLPSQAAAIAVRQRAEQGDAKAQAELGTMYLDGAGIKQDYVEALRWLRKAAEQGDRGGRFELGEMYLQGKGVEQDYVEAARWFGCPELDRDATRSCQFADVPREAQSPLLREKCDRDSADAGMAVKLQDGKPSDYQVCCSWPPHGLCTATVVANVGGTWKDVAPIGGGIADGFDRCLFFLPLKSQHNGFHDVCLPNECLPTGPDGKSCVTEVWQFGEGRYHAVPSPAASASR